MPNLQRQTMKSFNEVSEMANNNTQIAAIREWEGAPKYSLEWFGFRLWLNTRLMSSAQGGILAMALSWHDKHTRGQRSNAWHEISEYLGHDCPCGMCNGARVGVESH
jgi:hypothetical protein